MKRLFRCLSSTIVLLGLTLGFSGCTTVHPPSQQTIDTTAFILRGVAAAGAIAAVTPPTGRPENATYLRLAANGIGIVITGTNYSPTELQHEIIAAINNPNLNNPWVALGIAGGLELYNLYWGLWVRPDIQANAPIAVELLTAIQQGINDGLGPPTPSVAEISKYRNAAILPRPLPHVKQAK